MNTALAKEILSALFATRVNPRLGPRREAREGDWSCKCGFTNFAHRATEMEEEAAYILKKQGHAPPSGKRMDMLEAFIARAEKRAVNAEAGVREAEQKLAEATVSRDLALREVQEGKAKLTELRLELAASQSTPPPTMAVDVEGSGDPGPETEQVRAALLEVTAERDLLRASNAIMSPSAEMLASDLQTLQRDAAAAQQERTKLSFGFRKKSKTYGT